MAHVLIEERRIVLQEYGDPVLCAVDLMDWNALSKANARWRKALGLPSDPIRVDIVGHEIVQLRAEGVTGVVRVGAIDIEVVPKFLDAAGERWQAVLWQILTVVAGGYVDDNFTNAHELSSLSMPDLLAEVYLNSYWKGAARGLPRGYQTECATGGVLRGSLDMSRLDEWVARPWQLPYIADHLTDDTNIARLLRWTADILVGTVRHTGRARVLSDLLGSLNHIARWPPHLLDAQRISLGTQHQGLEAALAVGIMLLTGSGLHHAQGDHLLSGFLWNSDEIYENYIYWLCNKAAHRVNHRIDKRVIQFGEVLSGEGRKLETTPDVVFRDINGAAVAVTDSKYKTLGTRPKAADTYQILTAAHVLGCRRVSLTYPVAFARSPTVWRVASALGGSDVELTALPVNLMALAAQGGTEPLIKTMSDWLNNIPVVGLA